MNPMREVKIEKITLNMGVGESGDKLNKACNLLQSITGTKPVKTKTMKRIPTWGVRPKLEIGCKVTLRRQKAVEMLKRLLYAVDNTLKEKSFDNNGNFSFGIPEYIDIQDAKYDPAIGIVGLEVAITLERKGFRIKKRKNQPKKIHLREKITKQEAIEFMKKNFNLKLEEKES